MNTQSPWTVRAARRELPPDAHGARAYADRELRPIPLADVRLDIGGTIRTVGDLQRRLARENER